MIYIGWYYLQLSRLSWSLKPKVGQAKLPRAAEVDRGAGARPELYARSKSEETAGQGESQLRNQGHE